MDQEKTHPPGDAPWGHRLIEFNPVWKRYSALVSGGDRVLITRILAPMVEDDAENPDISGVIQRHVERRKRVNNDVVPKIEHINASEDGSVDFGELMPDGGSLTNLVRRGGRLRVDFVASLTWVLAEALDDLHEAGLGHYALSPEKVLISQQGAITLMGVGLADICYEVLPDFHFPDIRWEHVFPRPDFTAPELLRKEKPGSFSDVFGLAGLVFYALTGTAPFVGEDSMDVYTKVLKGEIPSIRQYHPAVSHSVDRGIREGLALAVTDRPEKPSKLAEALFGPKEEMDSMIDVCGHYTLNLSSLTYDAHMATQSPSVGGWIEGDSDGGQATDRGQQLKAATLMLEQMRSTQQERNKGRRMTLIISIVALLFALLVIPLLFF